MGCERETRRLLTPDKKVTRDDEQKSPWCLGGRCKEAFRGNSAPKPARALADDSAGRNPNGSVSGHGRIGRRGIGSFETPFAQQFDGTFGRDASRTHACGTHQEASLKPHCAAPAVAEAPAVASVVAAAFPYPLLRFSRVPRELSLDRIVGPPIRVQPLLSRIDVAAGRYLTVLEVAVLAQRKHSICGAWIRKPGSCRRR